MNGLRLGVYTLVLILICKQISWAQSAAELQVIHKKWIQYSDAPNLLYHHLAKESYRLLQKQEQRLATYKTIDDWKKRQANQKEVIWNALGKFPMKTPLNVRITNTIQKGSYRVENIIYESLPNYYVTASLFIPNGLTKPAPAILFCSGHSAQAYRRDIYQLPLLNLVNKGFIVLAIDPVSQGERSQYWDETERRSLIGGSTAEHSYPAPQAFLIGQSVARYFVWDGIRGIDYLVSRAEVDPKRIGVHGLSGGGTQTAYIAALDDRVVAAAPSGYITGYKRLIESIGVQDGEQNFYRGLAEGIDHADFLEIRAPKPTLIMATTSDFFNITGTREVYDRVKKVYTVMGKKDNFEIVEGDYVHGYTQNIREKMYSFFQKHLQNPGSSSEDSLLLLTETEIQKTSTGQIATSENTVETVFSLNTKEASTFLAQLAQQRKNFVSQNVIRSSQQLAGVHLPTHVTQPIFTGRVVKDSYQIERYFLKGEGEYPIPYLMIKPKGPIQKVVVYIHPESKSSSLTNLLENLIPKGIAVVVPDLLGIGELAPVTHKGDATIQGVSYNIWFTSVLNGRSIVGIQASDLIRLVQYIRQEVKGVPLCMAAEGEMISTVAHAAVVLRNEIEEFAFLNPYISFEEVLKERYYKPQYTFSLVAGALKSYDLPDLLATLVPKRLLIQNATDGKGIPVSESYLKSSYASVIQQYQVKNQLPQLRIEQVGSNAWKHFAEWIK